MSWLKNNLSLSWTAVEEYPALAEVWFRHLEHPTDSWETVRQISLLSFQRCFFFLHFKLHLNFHRSCCYREWQIPHMSPLNVSSVMFHIFRIVFFLIHEKWIQPRPVFALFVLCFLGIYLWDTVEGQINVLVLARWFRFSYLRFCHLQSTISFFGLLYCICHVDTEVAHHYIGLLSKDQDQQCVSPQSLICQWPSALSPQSYWRWSKK